MSERHTSRETKPVAVPLRAVIDAPRGERDQQDRLANDTVRDRADQRRRARIHDVEPVERVPQLLDRDLEIVCDQREQRVDEVPVHVVEERQDHEDPERAPLPDLEPSAGSRRRRRHHAVSSAPNTVSGAPVFTDSITRVVTRCVRSASA